METTGAICGAQGGLTSFFNTANSRGIVFARGYARSLGYIVGNILGGNSRTIMSSLRRGTIVHPLDGAKVSCSVTGVCPSARDAILRFRSGLGIGAGLIVVATTSGIAKRVLPCTRVTGVYGGQKVCFYLSTTRNTKVLPVGVRGVGVSCLYMTPRGKLCTPVKVNILVYRGNVRGAVLRNNAKASSLGFGRPGALPRVLRDNALGLPTVTNVSTKISFISTGKVRGVCDCRVGLYRVLCRNLLGGGGVILCASCPRLRGCTPILPFGMGSVGDRSTTTVFTGGSVTLETKLRYTPLTRGVLKARDAKTLETSFSIFGARGSMVGTVGITGGIWGFWFAVR